MVQRDAPEDYVIATGEAHSVRECLQIAFDQAGLGRARSILVIARPAFRRPAEVDHLIGVLDKAERDHSAGSPHRPSSKLIRLMVAPTSELLARR